MASVTCLKDLNFSELHLKKTRMVKLVNFSKYVLPLGLLPRGPAA